MDDGVSELFWDFYRKIRGDVIFAGILLVSLLTSLVLRGCGTFMKKIAGSYRFLDGIFGFILALIVTRFMILCSLLIVLFHLVLFKHVNNAKTLSNISFYGTFAYLAILRMMHYAGLPPLVHIANGIQLLMTLRVIGLSYEIADARVANAVSKLSKDGFQEDVREIEKILPKRTIPEPTSFEAFNYLYSFVGLFTGPYYTYQTFVDSEQFGRPTMKCLWKLLRDKAYKLYWSLPLLLAFSWLDPVDALRGEKINEYNKFLLIVWSALAFVYFRMRIYTAWMISESICITAGIGVYPAATSPRPGSGPTEKSFVFWSRRDRERNEELGGFTMRDGTVTESNAEVKLGGANEVIDIAGEELPKKTEDETLKKKESVSEGGDAYFLPEPPTKFTSSAKKETDCECSSETISNLNISQIEHSDGFRSGMRAWNRTVQFWLANFVYKRSHKSVRMPYTMLVSAFWHGIHPGYFLSFLTIPLCTTAEDLLFTIFPVERRPFWLSVTWSFIRMRGFESMACGFLLLTWDDTVRLWTNLYLWLHCTMITVIVISKIYLLICYRNSEDDEDLLAAGENDNEIERLKTD